ncbi:N-acetylgalactosamine-N,N'-diacetylbacillosaminyl-diphospho-undecaprenol 4-alpha-N-acetylgalactosaminyltransferase [Chryseobacterium sp. MOF25P]|uniref:glycosyltransferase n=1 Tax=unclassified Chryseobacterium TaxID=2593645 RepID=UPI0008057DED|nr:MULTISPECIES: glycosyltransferase [unclassified Chryseobacterium]OBW39419.1 N-acetylgalactosamine-N,N'-diacetylbacillosaminyl-diphospho-undecaprenol 4-alpha-N-acetylgalactosaminyltransferase [Chryseobacterium sp. MOF25P]OBW46957.1 N-acetylgalactosamine-N,N'-diacetylbacillosaminyl-diphospho-undecaprenol 4-alpha-N-acetylgalactosaminyltransferase [Chryseobacterium sp. BGARF1]
MSQKKKILIRIGSLRHGGAEKVLVTFLKNLPRDQYEIDLLLNLYSGKYLSDVPDWINIIYLNKGEMITTNRIQDIPKKAARVIYQTALKKLPTLLYNGKLKGKKYDIEFAAIHGMRDEIINSPLTSSKKIVWIHNDLSQVKEYTETEIKKFFAFDKIMVISEKIENLFLELAENETEKQKIVKIYNPLDTEEILSRADNPVINYEFDDAIPTFISVGTVFPQKGFDRLLKVHKKLLDEGLKHKILIVGDGYDFENIKSLKTELKADETATMLGFTDNPYPYFSKADFYILSSRYEGFPTVLFEAITLKKKIIATDVSGVKEMLNNGDLGLIVENSEDGIYFGMKKALLDSPYFDQYVNKLKDYEMCFNLENSVQKIISIIDYL